LCLCAFFREPAISGIAKQLEVSDRLSKNIQPDNIRSVQSNGGSGISFTPENLAFFK
jgi:hypothetical protein